MLDKKTKDLQYPLRNVVLCQEHKILPVFAPDGWTWTCSIRGLPVPCRRDSFSSSHREDLTMPPVQTIDP